MKTLDKLQERWQRLRDRVRLTKSDHEETAALGLPMSRAQRRQLLRAAGPRARVLRLQTHMRRPLRPTDREERRR